MWDLYNTYGWGGRLWLGDGIVICLICMLLVSVCDNCILQIAKLIKKIAWVFTLHLIIAACV